MPDKLGFRNAKIVNGKKIKNKGRKNVDDRKKDKNKKRFKKSGVIYLLSIMIVLLFVVVNIERRAACEDVEIKEE